MNYLFVKISVLTITTRSIFLVDIVMANEDNDAYCKDALLPWRYACDARGCTCLPIRKGVSICMDMGCKEHDSRGFGIGKHNRCVLANDLEWIVVHSFSHVDPSHSIHDPQFQQWTLFELIKASERTDDVEFVSNFFSRTLI